MTDEAPADRRSVLTSGALLAVAAIAVKPATASAQSGQLPSAAVAGPGARAFVNDAQAIVFYAVVAGGGSLQTPVFSDGAVWRVG